MGRLGKKELREQLLIGESHDPKPSIAVVNNQGSVVSSLTPDKIGQSGPPTGMIALSSTEIMRGKIVCFTANSFAYRRISAMYLESGYFQHS